VYGEKYLVLDRSLRHVAEALARGRGLSSF
jgi:hypothetical protein